MLIPGNTEWNLAFLDGNGNRLWDVALRQGLKVTDDGIQLGRIQRLLLGSEAEAGELREMVDVKTFGHGD